MSDTAPGGSAPPALRPRRRLAAVLTVTLPALTFLVGLLIGFGVWGAADEDADRAAAVPPASVTGGPGAGTDTTERTVPDECLAAIDEAVRSRTLLEEAVAAVGDFDVSRLRQLVEDVRAASTEIRDLGEECRAQAEVSAGTTGAAPPS